MLINASYICKRSSFESGCSMLHVLCQEDGRLGTCLESLFWITREHSGLELSSFFVFHSVVEAPAPFLPASLFLSVPDCLWYFQSPASIRLVFRSLLFCLVFLALAGCQSVMADKRRKRVCVCVCITVGEGGWLVGGGGGGD